MPQVEEDEGRPGKVNSIHDNVIKLKFENSVSNSSEFDCKEAIEDDLVGDGFFENLMNNVPDEEDTQSAEVVGLPAVECMS